MIRYKCSHIKLFLFLVPLGRLFINMWRFLAVVSQFHFPPIIRFAILALERGKQMVVNNTITVPAGHERQSMEATVKFIHLISAWLKAHRDKVGTSYFIPERGGFGWYVIGKENAYDFDLNRELVEYGNGLIRQGFPIHSTLLPGAVSPQIPRDAIVVQADGGVITYAD